MTNADGTPPEEDSSLLRPYVVTKGRTRPSTRDLRVESIISRISESVSPSHSVEEQAIWVTCQTPMSLAEVSAHLSLPLGVTLILVSDLVDSGHLTVGGELEGGTDDLLARIVTAVKNL